MRARRPSALLAAPCLVTPCLAVLCLAAVAAAPGGARAQTPVAVVRQAAPADVGSEDAIISALYDVISGPAGEVRDWDRFRSLFRPGAVLTGTGRGPDGVARARTMTVEDYIARNGPVLTERGFFETETGRRGERIGPVVALLSGYESRATEDGEPFDRGVNAIHLYDDGRRFWVVAITWASIPPGGEAPPGLLPE